MAFKTVLELPSVKIILNKPISTSEQHYSKIIEKKKILTPSTMPQNLQEALTLPKQYVCNEQSLDHSPITQKLQKPAFEHIFLTTQNLASSNGSTSKHCLKH